MYAVELWATCPRVIGQETPSSKCSSPVTGTWAEHCFARPSIRCTVSVRVPLTCRDSATTSPFRRE